MDFGLTFGHRGATGNPDGIAARAQQADKLGFAYLGMPDHIVFPRQTDSRYPYRADGKHPSTSSGYCLDQLACLSFVAALTQKVRLLTSVMVVPHRHPVLAAKTLTTVDVLSKGRLTVGVGVGWLEEEMAVLGGPPYAQRGAASDTYIRTFKKLWADDGASIAGETWVDTESLNFEPKPVQRPGPPIWVGGEGKAARRRVAQLGDAWYPVIYNPKERLDTPKAFADALADVRQQTAAAGRDPSAIDVAVYANSMSIGEERKNPEGKRLAFTGTAANIVEDVQAYAEAGARHILVGFEASDLQLALDRTAQFATDIMAKCK
jgi:probable F420-dependent oxidoreductase